MASMYNSRGECSQDVCKYTFASAPTYQDHTTSSRAIQNDCNAAGGSCGRSAQSQYDRMPVGYSSFDREATRAKYSLPTRPFRHGLFGDPDKPVTFGSFGSSNFGLAATPSNDFTTSHDSTRVHGFGASGTHHDDTRLNPNVPRYPSPTRCLMSRKRGLISHCPKPELDTEFVSKTPFYDKAFSTFGRF